MKEPYVYFYPILSKRMVVLSIISYIKFQQDRNKNVDRRSCEKRRIARESNSKSIDIINTVLGNDLWKSSPDIASTHLHRIRFVASLVLVPNFVAFGSMGFEI